MRQRKHALSGALYDVRDDGNLTVTVARRRDRASSRPTVEWVSGDVHHADPHLCGWLAGPQLPPRLAVLPRFRQTESATADSTAPARKTVTRDRDRLHQAADADLPAAARHRQPRRCPRCCAGSRRCRRATRTSPSSATRAPSSTGSRSRRSGRRSGRWRAARRTSPRSATTSPTTSSGGRSSSCARRPTRSRRSTTSACTAAAGSASDAGPRHRAALRVPRLRLEARRLPQAGAVPVGLPAGRTRRVGAARGARRHVGRLRVHQPGPRLRPARGPPRRPRRPLRHAGRSRIATRRPTSPR